MKILFLQALTDPASGGGAEVSVWVQMRGLQGAGHDWVLLATTDRAGLHQEPRDGIRVWLAGMALRRAHNPAARALWYSQDSYNPWMQGYLRQVIAAEKASGDQYAQSGYPQVAVAVVPSLWNESFGMVVAEAMAFGKPVIGARREDIPEMIVDEVNSILFDPDNPDVMLMALKKFGHATAVPSRFRGALCKMGGPLLAVRAQLAWRADKASGEEVCAVLCRSDDFPQSHS